MKNCIYGCLSKAGFTHLFFILVIMCQTQYVAYAQFSPTLGNTYYNCFGIEHMPELPGGGSTTAIIKAIQQQIKYPEEALKSGIQGRVFISFTVGPDGVVRDARVVKGIGGGCDEAVLAAVNQLPILIPGRQAGQAVPVSFTLPITFKIPSPSRSK